MPLTLAEEIETAALRLTVSERARLAQRLLASLDDADGDPKVEQAWAEEIDRRLDEYERGEAKSIPADEVLARARLQRRNP